MDHEECLAPGHGSTVSKSCGRYSYKWRQQVLLSAAPLQGSGDSPSARQELPLCWESGFPNSDCGGKDDGDGVLAGPWAVVRVRRRFGAGVTCCRSLRSGTLSSGTVRGSGDGGGGEIFGAGFEILRR